MRRIYKLKLSLPEYSSTNQSNNQSTKQPTNQPTNKSTNQPTNLITNHSTNQSTDQPTHGALRVTRGNKLVLVAGNEANSVPSFKKPISNNRNNQHKYSSWGGGETLLVHINRLFDHKYYKYTLGSLIMLHHSEISALCYLKISSL